jgi:hypothetical protein
LTADLETLMPIVEADLLYKLSTVAGAAGNTQAQPDPNASLGKYISTTEVNLGAPLRNLFDDVTGDENAAADVEYRCLFVHNSHATITWLGAVAWISAEVAGGADVAIGVDPAGPSPIGQVAAQAAQIANEGAAPAGVAFSAPVTKETGLALGDLDAGECRAIWVRRTATDSAAKNNDGCTLSVSGDTTE